MFYVPVGFPQAGRVISCITTNVNPEIDRAAVYFSCSTYAHLASTAVLVGISGIPELAHPVPIRCATTVPVFF